ncbi:MAG TPA: hypothetical protein VGH33_16750 [Isosphaeraceae bacterium]
MLRSRFWIVAFAAACALGLVAAASAGEAFASRTFTVQPGGPQTGRTGAVFFNVEGRKNGDSGKYASFGVLEFPAAEFAEVGKGGTLTLTLTQSVARFSADGPLKIYLATTNLDPRALKFDLAGIDGLGSQVSSKSALGSVSFKKAETGKADSFTLTLDDASRDFIKARASKGEPIQLVVAPDDETVAATYLGAGPTEATRRPRLAVGTPK